jgi:hypothetical protein
MEFDMGNIEIVYLCQVRIIVKEMFGACNKLLHITFTVKSRHLNEK